jgi:hypothetical protein
MAVFPSALVGGFIGTMVLATMARGASELGWTRMDLAFLLGTMLTDHDAKPRRWATGCSSGSVSLSR